MSFVQHLDWEKEGDGSTYRQLRRCAALSRSSHRTVQLSETYKMLLSKVKGIAEKVRKECTVDGGPTSPWPRRHPSYRSSRVLTNLSIPINADPLRLRYKYSKCIDGRPNPLENWRVLQHWRHLWS